MAHEDAGSSGEGRGPGSKKRRKGNVFAGNAKPDPITKSFFCFFLPQNQTTMTDLASRLAAAGTDPAALRAVALADAGAESSSQDDIKARETAVTSLCDALATAGDADGLASLLTDLRPLFGSIPKAKTAKIVRGVIEAIARVPGSEELQVCVGCGCGGVGGASPQPTAVGRAAWGAQGRRAVGTDAAMRAGVRNGGGVPGQPPRRSCRRVL